LENPAVHYWIEIFRERVWNLRKRRIKKLAIAQVAIDETV